MERSGVEGKYDDGDLVYVMGCWIYTPILMICFISRSAIHFLHVYISQK